MPARNINLTARNEDLVKSLVESGKFQNASEVIRAGLLLLEKQEAKHELKLQSLRNSLDTGLAAYEAGDFESFEDEVELDQLFRVIEIENE